jgi:Ser/Thr protein kinase RdoA (MazF antagonist)
MLLENWEYDKNALNMLDYYRISGNAIYPYKNNGEIFFLRFAPYDEKMRREMYEEIKFVQFLHEKGMDVLEPILSKSGKYLLNKNTPWGNYLVCAFKRVEGDRLDGFGSDGIDYTDELITGYGKALGKLHKYSSQYKKVTKKTCFEMLDEMENKLNSKNEIFSKELVAIRDCLKTIPQNSSNFGLIHGDFELDNIFYVKELKKYSVIDFGSSMYHWYIMDIEITLNCLKEEIPQNDFEKMKTLFINGYKEEYLINDNEFNFFPIFRRFENMRKYIGLKETLEEKWDNEPLWMIELRENLNKLLGELENSIEKQKTST